MQYRLEHTYYLFGDHLGQPEQGIASIGRGDQVQKLALSPVYSLWQVIWARCGVVAT